MRAYIVALAVAASSLAAQTKAAPASTTLVSVARAQWMQAHDYVLRSAQMLPDSLLGFMPVAGVRTFAQHFGHVAASEMTYCGAVLGDPAKDEGPIEKSATTKAAIVALLNESSKYCERAYAISDSQASASFKLFGRDRTRFYALVENATHDWEHYGNLVTYLRINRMVPPSSQ